MFKETVAIRELCGAILNCDAASPAVKARANLLLQRVGFAAMFGFQR